MKVSIVIPCYNDGIYLNEILPYAINQTYEKKEIIIVNDGSTDCFTNEFLKSIEGAVKVIHQENKGLGAARNAGIREANGELILTWDADDYYEIDFLEKAVQVINSNEIVAVTARVKQFGDYNDSFLPKSGSLEDFLMGNSWPSSALFRKSSWEVVGGYDENRLISSFADWDFWIRLASCGHHFEVIETTTFHYRVTKKSMYKNSLDKSKEMIEYIFLKNRKIIEPYLNQIAIKLHVERLTLYEKLKQKRLENINLVNEKYNQSVVSVILNKMFR